MVSVQDEQGVHCASQYGVHLVVVANLEHHVQEVLAVGQRVVWHDEGETLAEAVTHCSDGGNLCYEAKNLLVECVFIEDVF